MKKLIFLVIFIFFIPLIFVQGAEEWVSWFSEREGYLVSVPPAAGMALNLVTELDEMDVKVLKERFDEYNQDVKNASPVLGLETTHQIITEVMNQINKALVAREAGDFENYSYYQKAAVETYIKMIKEMQTCCRQHGAPKSMLSAFDFTLWAYKQVLNDIK